MTGSTARVNSVCANTTRATILKMGGMACARRFVGTSLNNAFARAARSLRVDRLFNEA
jgi:hypothetical protein